MAFIAKPASHSQTDIPVPMGIYQVHSGKSGEAKNRFNQLSNILVGTLTGGLTCLDTQKISENIAGLLNGVPPVHRTDSDKIIHYTKIKTPKGQHSFVISEYTPSTGGIPTAKSASVMFTPDPAYEGNNLFTPDFFAKLCGTMPYSPGGQTSRRMKKSPSFPHV